MSFSNMLEILQEKNKNKIVLIKAGVFYIATGKDAVFLNKQFQLKCICFTEGVCKVGIPEKRLEYYAKKLEKLNLAYVIYHFDNHHEELIQKEINEGKYHKEDKCNKNCLICKGIRCYKEENIMPKTIRNEYDKKLTYDNLMKAYILNRKGKGYREEVILFNLKQEEYIMWLYERLKMDIRKYFDNIDKDILFGIMKRRSLDKKHTSIVVIELELKDRLG